MDSRSLFLARAFLGKRVTVRIDRPLGSRHPKHGFLYLANYGFVPGVVAPDGRELDAYVLAVDEPLRAFTGWCIAIVHRLDDDDKLVVVPEGVNLSDAEILPQTDFQERFFDVRIVRK